MPMIGRSARSNTISWMSRISWNRGPQYAADHGLGIVIMEPLRGGMLTRDIPSINNIWKKAPVRRSLPEWALRWVWNHPEVTVVLSGMSSFEQVEQNVKYAKSGLPDSLSQEELSLLKRWKSSIRSASRFHAQAADTVCRVHPMSASLSVLKCTTRAACSKRLTLPASNTILH